MKALFDDADVSKSGSLDKEELSKVIKLVYAQNQTSRTLAKVTNEK